ncbi:MAG: hypothetical protein JW780_08250, partial [Clostridiales bacterium]|nr:hypothetical protein [Clostridiales bacterium]
MGKQTLMRTIRNYFSMILTSRKISTAVTVNRLILFCQRIPFVGRFVPDSLYGQATAKIALLVIGNIYRLNKRVIIKAIYIGLLFVFSYTTMEMAEQDLSRLPIDAVMTFFFFASFVCAPLMLSKAMNLDVGTDLMIIDKLRVDSGTYVPARIFERKVIDFFATLPFAVVLSFHERLTLIEALAILPLMTAAKWVGEGIFLAVFSFARRFSKTAYKPLSYVFIVLTVLLMLLPFGFVLSGNVFPFKEIVFHPAFIAALLILAAFSILYVYRYRHYHELAWGSVVNYNLAMEKVKPAQKKQQFGDSAKWNKNLKEDDIRSNRFYHLTGYAFFNRLFFARHRKFFIKKIVIRSAIGLAMVVGLIALLLLVRENIDEEIARLLPICFFLGYLLSVGRHATAAMFANCDVAMLSYPFYRTPSVVIKNFYLRLRTILTYNAPAFFLLAVFAVIADILAPWIQEGSVDQVQWTMTIPYFVTMIMMWIFFS